MSSRIIPDKEANEILKLSYEDMTRTWILNNISKKYDKENRKIIEAKYSPQDKLYIPKGMCCNNKEPISTTLGRFIFNKKVIEPDLSDIIGYINEPVTEDKLKEIYSKLGELLLEDKITTKQLRVFHSRIEWFFNFTRIITTGFDKDIIKPDREILKERDRLFKENKEAIDKGDIAVAVDIEEKLISMAKNKYKDRPSYDIYASGSNGNFGNHYKNMNIMQGPILNLSTGGYHISKNNFMDGIALEEVPMLADATVLGAYSKGVGTQLGGYMTKKNLAAFQAIVIDEKGTDCGTKKTIDIRITKYIAKMILYSYIVENGKYVLLTKENIKSYIGKEVKLRSPMCCNSTKKCNICSGELYYNLGINNVGLTIVKESGQFMQMSMKTFHDKTVKMADLEITDDLIL